MTRSCWLCAVVCLCLVVLGLRIGRTAPQAYVLRFSDTVPTLDAAQQTTSGALPGSAPDAPAAPANAWLKSQGWK